MPEPSPKANRRVKAPQRQKPAGASGRFRVLWIAAAALSIAALAVLRSATSDLEARTRARAESLALLRAWIARNESSVPPTRQRPIAEVATSVERLVARTVRSEGETSISIVDPAEGPGVEVRIQSAGLPEIVELLYELEAGQLADTLSLRHLTLARPLEAPQRARETFSFSALAMARTRDAVE